MKKRIILVGEWFLVPLVDGGYSLGLAARVRKLFVVGYFFPKVYLDAPSIAEIEEW